MNKYLFFILSFIVILVNSCTQEEISESQTASQSKEVFVASFEQNDSRTYIESGKYLRWTANDELSIFKGTTLNRQFRFIGKTGDNSGEFNETSNHGVTVGNNIDNPCHYAVYPYNESNEISEKGILSITLPSKQSYSDNSFGLGDNTMVAITENLNDYFLAFKNVSGYLKFQLYGEGVTVKSITLKGNNGEKLAGSANITASYGSEPTVILSSDATETITLDCGENGVQLGSDKEKATAFWFVLPPTTFNKGFTITVEDINGNKIVKTSTKVWDIKRNVVKPVSAINCYISTILENESMYYGYLAMADVAEFKKMRDVTHDFSLLTAEEVLAGVTKGTVIKESLTSKQIDLNIPIIVSCLFVLVPESSSLEATIFDGIGQFVEFSGTSTEHGFDSNGESRITINGVTFKIYGENSVISAERTLKVN